MTGSAATLPDRDVQALERSQRVKEHARELGFDLVGIAPPALPEAWERYKRAVDLGYGAEMTWLTDNPDVRRDAREVHPSTRAVVVLGVSYGSDQPGYLEKPPEPEEGWIARYAQGKDYHAYIRKMLIRLAKRLASDPLLGMDSKQHRVFVDTGPLLEKAYAQRAGLGWIGKNTLLINRPLGSWVFLAVILTPLELAFDSEGTDHCGSCRRCLDVCPTGAFPEPYVLDARRCIATWTIETREPAKVIDAEKLGQHVFGCDLCQEICPWNRAVEATSHAPLSPREENIRPRLETLFGLTKDEFRTRFPSSAVRRVGPHQVDAVVDAIRSRHSDSGKPGESS